MSKEQQNNETELEAARWLDGLEKQTRNSIIKRYYPDYIPGFIMLLNTQRVHIYHSENPSLTISNKEEDNNGWIKIESEDDLPKEDCDCWFLNYDGKMHQIPFTADDKRIFADLNTHYQIIIIEKPLPPKF